MQAFHRNSVFYKQHTHTNTFHSLIPTQRITVIAIQKVILLNFPSSKPHMNIFRVASPCHLARLPALSSHFYRPLSTLVMRGRGIERERLKNTHAYTPVECGIQHSRHRNCKFVSIQMG